jgi:hypothetical protein
MNVVNRFSKHNTEFHENPSSKSQYVPQEQKDGRTDRPKADMKQLIVAFRNFAKVPKNNCFVAQYMYLALQCAQKNKGCLGLPQKIRLKLNTKHLRV